MSIRCGEDEGGMAFGFGAKRWAGRNVLFAGAEGRAFWVKVVPKGLGDGVGGAVPIDLYTKAIT